MTRGALEICALALLAFFLFPSPAHAYLDPSTGSMLLSAVVAFFAAIAMTARTYWHRVASLVRRKPKTPPHTPGSAGR